MSLSHRAKQWMKRQRENWEISEELVKLQKEAATQTS